MTCIVASAWHPFNDVNPWPSMNPDIPPTHGTLERQPSHDYVSSESESRMAAGSSSSKKRASRAGTRSVSTLSAAQLERKRANDREAQRAIRQRTKDHIDHLEKTISDLRGNQESQEKIVAVTHQRNHELEEENAYLRSKLSETGYSLHVPVDTRRPPDPALLSVQSTSPAATQASVSGSSIQRPASTSTPRSISVTTQSSNSRHSSFPQVGNFMTSQPTGPVPVGGPGATSEPQNLAAWRPHDPMQGTHPLQQVAPHSHDQSPHAYSATTRSERVEWPPNTPQYHYQVGQDTRPSNYEHQQPNAASQPAPQAFVQTPVRGFPQPPTSQPQPYHPPQLPPQSEYQAMAVHSPVAYQAVEQQTYQQPHPPQIYPGPPSQAFASAPQPPPQTQAFQHQASPVYHMTALQAPTPTTGDYATHGHMQPTHLSSIAYHQPATEQHYASSQQPQPIAFRDESGGHGYTLTHYPTG